MILMAFPYRNPKENIFTKDMLKNIGLDLPEWRDGEHNIFTDNHLKRITNRQSVEVTEVRLRSGTKTDTGERYEGPLSGTSKGNTTIFHIRYIGIRPMEGMGMSGGDLDKLGNTISDFEKN